MSEVFISDLLKNIRESISLIDDRFLNIKSPEDFVLTPSGTTTLDAIAMRLQFIGESLKKIRDINDSFFSDYPQIEWSKIIQLRNFISHHYEMLDYQIIFDICQNHIPELKITIQNMLRNMK